MSPDDAGTVARQLGRPPRGRWSAVARCPRGLPSAIAVAPRLEDGSPFPTAFWLTCPLLVSAAHAAESAGEHVEWAARLQSDSDLAAAVLAADARYRDARAHLDEAGDPCASVGVAGQRDPLQVKCLHARMAAALAGMGDPIGEELLGRCGETLLACDGGPCEARDARDGNGRTGRTHG